MKNNSLSSTDNYKSLIEENETVLFLKYVGLIHELFECVSENINIKNNEYSKHILIKGIKNTLYIYTFLLLYTKNLELTVYHTQKSILYYVEFMGQLGEDNHNFLKLSSKDATMFVYKKTIFDVNNEYKQQYIETQDTKYKLSILKQYTSIYNNIVIQVVLNNDIKTCNISELQKILYIKIYKIVEVLIQLPLSCKNNSEVYLSKLLKINSFVDDINANYNINLVNSCYIHLLELLIKKGLKIDLDNISIITKLTDSNAVNKLTNVSLCKVVNYLLS
jgi:hypothetical protein